ncbi:MAG: ComEA family DNA-binding protein [Flavobacteriales bacterium]|jgi:DNA uptake protein ComE-like DNA-binding protein|tara:strand:- start:3001 stop:3873 length:873 start_codon:yes stop_codon:yes gene_type:complete
MNLFKSHFWHHKGQRNGVFLLGVVVLFFQLVIVFIDFSSDGIENINTTDAAVFYKQIDSLKVIRFASKKFKKHPFNPNYITDGKGAELGMSLDAIDRLLAYRKTGKFVNSKRAFQKVTGISDVLLEKISPFFKFPDWVIEVNRNKKRTPSEKVLIKITTTDLNKATASDLRTVVGVGAVFSERIIKYRSKLQGFSMQRQLYEVWGLEEEIADKVVAVFKVLKLPNIQKLNVNTVTFKELLKTPYINYELCKKIFEYRDSVAELQSISELKNITGFPLDLYERIVLYLLAE